MNDYCWLPDYIYYNDYESWNDYQEYLYDIFKIDFIDNKPIYKKKPVNIRRHPIEFGKEEAFYHVTCQDFLKNGERVPDFRRCERIKWVRSFIENFDRCPTSCSPCDGIKVWAEPYNNTHRIHLLFEEERYIVVIEKRDTYFLLITAYYFEYDNTLNKKLRKYHQYKNAT